MKKGILGVVIAVCILTGGYFAMCRYYENSDFVCGTWINGMYCAGKTMSEVENELLEQVPKMTLTLVEYGGKEEIIDEEALPEDTIRYDFMPALSKISSGKKAGNWLVDTFHSVHYDVTPEKMISREALNQATEQLICMRKAKQQTTLRVTILKTEKGYILQDEKANVLDVDLTKEQIYQALMAGEPVLDLQQAGCYQRLPYTETDEEILAKWEKISAFQDCGIVYAFGDETKQIDASVTCNWIAFDKEGEMETDSDGNLVLDREKVKEFVRELAEEYDTYGGIRQFQSTRGDLVTIEGGTYGNKMDQKAEVKYLTEAFLGKKTEVHEPVYEHKAWAQGKNDIGDTYIEVDMGEQMMYYYEKGTCLIQTPIVTGNMMRKRDTPAAVCFIYGKQKNRVLRGPGYASRVKFWMPVKGGIGIHDASWRKEFGGEIYKTEGSHGCINTPYEAMEKLYERAEIGTPVVMFY